MHATLETEGQVISVCNAPRNLVLAWRVHTQTWAVQDSLTSFLKCVHNHRDDVLCREARYELGNSVATERSESIQYELATVSQHSHNLGTVTFRPTHAGFITLPLRIMMKVCEKATHLRLAHDGINCKIQRSMRYICRYTLQIIPSCASLKHIISP
jgi:hypothetical protein